MRGVSARREGRGMGQPAQQVWEYLLVWIDPSKYGENIWNLFTGPYLLEGTKPFKSAPYMDEKLFRAGFVIRPIAS